MTEILPPDTEIIGVFPTGTFQLALLRSIGLPIMKELTAGVIKTPFCVYDDVGDIAPFCTILMYDVFELVNMSFVTVPDRFLIEMSK